MFFVGSYSSGGSNPRISLLTVDLEPEGQSRYLSDYRRLLDTGRACTIAINPSHQSKAYRLRDVVKISEYPRVDNTLRQIFRFAKLFFRKL